MSLLRRPQVTHPSSQEGQGRDDPLLGDALQDPGRSVQAAHAGSQGGDVEAQQKEEAHQGDLEEEGKQTEAGRGWGGAAGSQQRRPVQFRCSRPLMKTMKTPRRVSSKFHSTDEPRQIFFTFCVDDTKSTDYWHTHSWTSSFGLL